MPSKRSINLGLPINGKELEQLPENELAARIRFLGLPDSIVKGLDPQAATSNLLPIKTPLDGMVAERQVSAGELVDSTKNLFVIADLSRIWIVASVRQEDVDRLAMGQPVTFQADGHPGDKALSGDVSWISTEVDEKTRSMRARAVIDNPKEHLRAHTFVRRKSQFAMRPKLSRFAVKPCSKKEAAVWFSFGSRMRCSRSARSGWAS